MAIIKCPECGRPVSEKAKMCPNCGVEIEGKIKKCPECGNIVFVDQDECPTCHHRFHGIAEYEDTNADNLVESTNVVVQNPSEYVTNEKVTNGGKNNKIVTIVVVSLVAVLIIVFGGLHIYNNTQDENELEAYENALDSNEPTVLQSYLDMYGDAPVAHRDSILARLDIIRKNDVEWTNAVLSGSKAALERYIKMHPESAHLAEAKIKIDSLDWAMALSTNTPEAYQEYIDNHMDGLYVDEARNRFENLDAQKVTPNDEQAISSLFSGYFTALSANDEDGITACVANIMTSFLHKTDATKSDVISHMKKLHSQSDITRMTFRLNNDWKITKSVNDSGDSNYNVSFSVDQKVEFTDPANNTFATFKVDAKVSSDIKITELNMRKIVQ